MPGQENSVSTTVAPDTMKPRLIAVRATTGRIALRVAWWSTRWPGRPTARLVVTKSSRRVSDSAERMITTHWPTIPIVSVRMGRTACCVTFQV